MDSLLFDAPLGIMIAALTPLLLLMLMLMLMLMREIARFTCRCDIRKYITH